MNNVFHVAETVSGGGDCLVFMLTDPSLGADRGGLYYNNTLSPGTPRPVTPSCPRNRVKNLTTWTRRVVCGRSANPSWVCKYSTLGIYS